MYKQSALLIVFCLLLQLAFPLASAMAALEDAELRFYRLKTSTAANTTDAKILVKLTPGLTATENEVRVTFATGYTVNATAANITVSTAGLPTECTAVPTIGSAASGVTGQAVDFTSGDLTANTTYCFFITGGITSPSSASSYTNTIATLTGTNTVSESSSVAVAHIANDQVVVSAVVPPTFTFALGANTTAFTADLSPSAVRSTTGVTATITTNASNGWTAFLRSANAALNSAVSGDSISTTGTIDNTPTTLATGSESYQLDVDETTDSSTNGAIDAEYNGTTTSQGGTFNGSDLEAIAAGTGPTNNYVMTLIGRATISGITQAANDYTDTWTVVASGNF